MGPICRAQTSLFLINAEVFPPKAQTVPSSPVTEVFPKQYISIIMGRYRAQLGEEERDVCLADSFTGKCLFRVGLSAWLLLLGSHFSLLALYQLSFTPATKRGEADKESARELQKRSLSVSWHRLSRRFEVSPTSENPPPPG